MLLYIFNNHTTTSPYYFNFDIEKPKLVSIKVEFLPPSNLNFVKSRDLTLIEKNLPMNNVICVQVFKNL